MASNETSAEPGEGVLQRGFGRALLIFGGLAMLAGIYLPLVSVERGWSSTVVYSLVDFRDIGAPAIWPVVTGAILLIVLSAVLGERFQTPELVAGVLVVTCAQAFATVLWTAIGFTLMWTETKTARKLPDLQPPELKYGAYLLIIGLALAVAGSIWWCIQAKGREE